MPVAPTPPAASTDHTFDLLSVVIHNDWSFSIRMSALVFIGIAVATAIPFIWRRLGSKFFFKDFEMESLELAPGDTKVKFRPNVTDRQVGYQIWVELSTRKIGLEIDLEHDVIKEVYESWYNYFSVTRELIKTVPVSKLSSGSTRTIIDLSIRILNDGLRPHLTKWHARYDSWYLKQLEKRQDFDPQEIQKGYPHYAELTAEMKSLNAKLIAYRNDMRRLVF